MESDLLYVAVVAALTTWACIISKLLWRRVFSPPVLMAFGWLVPSLVTIIPGPFDWKLENVGRVAVALAYIAFLMGYFSAGLPLARLWQETRSRDYAISVWTPAVLMRLIASAWLAGMSGLFLNLARVIRQMGWDAYLRVPFRDIEMVFGASRLTNYLYFANMALREVVWVG